MMETGTKTEVLYHWHTANSNRMNPTRKTEVVSPIELALVCETKMKIFWGVF